jgi:hypothetical protein
MLWYRSGAAVALQWRNEATIVRFVRGTEPQSMHSSELLLGDSDFFEMAKVSVGEPKLILKPCVWSRKPTKSSIKFVKRST